MANTCTDTNALTRSGSSQAQRVLQALLPKNAAVDERSYADLILFAKKYGAYLNFYNADNVPDGDWQAIMSMDVSVTLAGISKIDVPDYTAYVKIIYNNIQAAASDADAAKFFKTVFDFIFSVATELDDYYKLIPADFAFKEYFSSTIQARLQEPMQRLTDYYAQFVAAGYVDPTSTFSAGDAPVNMILSQDFDLNDLGSAWQPTLPVPVIQLSVPDPSNISNSIYHIITHNLFNAQLDIVFKTLSNIVSQSAVFLDETLTNFPSHTPHYALYIAFLHLFKKAQDQLNGYAAKHLDFYYKDVLRLKTNDAIPDSVHLIIELQKGIEQRLLSKGTLFKGGKDVDGVEISYAADDDTVINRAAIKSLQSIYVQPNVQGAQPFETVYAAHISNSEDGEGGKILSAGKEWFPFGNPDKVKEAALGFLIASHYLYLNEATRTITITFSFEQSFSIANAELNGFNLQLTGKKGWFDVTSYTAVANAPARTITFTMVLQGDAPPIVGYTAKVHKENYTTDLPVLRFMLDMKKGASNPYKKLKALTLNNIAVNVKVEGVKDVMIQNDEGSLDPAKPFTPFGSQPKVGSSFILGSKEIFQKKLTQLSIVVDWDEVPDTLVDQLDEALHEYERSLNYIDVKRKFHTVKTYVLSRGKWNLLDSQKGIFIEDNLYNVIYNWTRPDYKYAGKLSSSDVEHAVINITPNNIQPNSRNYDKNEAYSNTSIDGFVRLDLNSPDFGHSSYPAALRNAAQSVSIQVTGANTANMSMSVQPTSTLPKEPYTPKVKSLSVNYSASTQINLQTPTSTNFEGKESFFYHVTPFGFAEVNKNLQTPTTLVPAYNNEGELFIGIENLQPSTTLKVLFQVADGTSNPLKEENEVLWFYLSQNRWKAFEKTDVVDATKNFTQSGIVTFIFQEDINVGNTLFDTSLSWLKAAVAKDADAVCKLISVLAQAIKATLVSTADNKVYFKQILPANTISKLLTGDAAIKKITQPFESFGGRAKELSDQFYTRVSERLRHKQRAIAAWDYERIVLQQFPTVYKTKCINHTGLIPAKVPGTTRYSETAPGHVTVVTIPNLQNVQFKNPLKPYTSIGLLTNIKDYLLTVTSPFVKLNVINPKFEEVQFQFDVKITPPLDESFFVKQLSIDIEQFLCPWAYNNGSDIEFGGKISKSVVLNFIEERYYVDYVTCFRMNHFVDRGTADYVAFYDVEEAKTTTGISILVSYFDEVTNTRHLINAGVPCPC